MCKEEGGCVRREGVRRMCEEEGGCVRREGV